MKNFMEPEIDIISLVTEPITGVGEGGNTGLESGGDNEIVN